MRVGAKSIVAALAIAVGVVSMEGRQAGAPLPPTLLPAIVANLVVTLSWVPNGAGPGGFQMISGRWTDNRGCVKTSGIFGGMPLGLPQISVESLACNDRDFGLRVTSVNGNVYSGICLLGGPSCTFQMTRQ